MPKPPKPRPTRRGFITGSLAGAGTVLAAPKALGGSRDDLPPIVFRDRFQRESTSGWGRPWFNQRYGHSWSISNGFGRYDLPGPRSNKRFPPNPVLVLDAEVTDVELEATLAVTDLSARVGLLARACSYFDYLVAFLSGEALILARCDYHGVHTIARKDHALNPSLTFRMRFRIRGNNPQKMWAKVWTTGHPEPGQWQVFGKSSATEVAAPGAFGFYTQHSNDRITTSAAVTDFTARSSNERRPTPPSVVYSLAGAPYDDGSKTLIAARSSVPAEIGFEFGTDPAFGPGTQVIAQQPAVGPSQVVKADIDISSLGSSQTVHWRAWANRKGMKVYGETSRFKTPPTASGSVKFAFGSCARWGPVSRTSFETARSQSPDFFLHEGDFGYVVSNTGTAQSDAYQDHWIRMFGDPALRGLAREVPISLQRDDAEYGEDMATSATIKPFTIDAHGNLFANPSNDPFWFSYGGVAVFCLDCRRFSTGSSPPEAERSRLGQEQTAWLTESMQAAVEGGATVLVVASPMAFGSPDHPQAWVEFYRSEWDSLMAFFAGLNAPVLIVSGNSHVHRVLEGPGGSAPAKVVEFVSSGTEQTGWPVMTDQNIKNKVIKANAFGVVEVGEAQLQEGRTTRTVRLSCLKSGDGSAWFQSEYLAVEGVGLIPASSL